MALKKSIPFSNHHEVIPCLPTLRHCSKGPKSSASISSMDIEAIGLGLKKRVEVWDQRESKLYVLDAQAVLKLLYPCGSSDFMAFMYKAVKPLEVR